VLAGLEVGLVFISFFPDLIYKKPPTLVLDERFKDTAVLINLSKWTNGNLQDIVLGSWARRHPDTGTLVSR
jgi:hypothetical protein